VPLTVDFEERLVVGLDDVDFKVVALGALGVVGPPAAFVVAGHGQADHVPADEAEARAFAAAIDVVQSLDPPQGSVIAAIGVEHKARNVDVLLLPTLFPLPRYPETQVGVAFGEIYMVADVR
jgi:hypothetical protein